MQIGTDFDTRHPFKFASQFNESDCRSAARSSRSTVGDLAGVPLLISAPCSHCEQISTRGSDAAVAPTWPQCGQVIRVSMSVDTAADGAAASISR
jgi:hypothetical protein